MKEIKSVEEILFEEVQKYFPSADKGWFDEKKEANGMIQAALKAMKIHHAQFNISDEEIENELSLLTPQSKGFYFEQRLFGSKWMRDKIFPK